MMKRRRADNAEKDAAGDQEGKAYTVEKEVAEDKGDNAEQAQKAGKRLRGASEDKAETRKEEEQIIRMRVMVCGWAGGAREHALGNRKYNNNETD